MKRGKRHSRFKNIHTIYFLDEYIYILKKLPQLLSGFRSFYKASYSVISKSITAKWFEMLLILILWCVWLCV